MTEQDLVYAKIYEDWQRATDAMLNAMPDDYHELTSSLRSADDEFRNAVAKRLEPVLNKSVGSMFSFDTYREKKKAAAWINEEVAQFGLALVCPETKAHSMLVADRDYYRTQGEGRLHFQHRSAANAAGIERTSTFDLLPHLEIIPTFLEQPAWDRLLYSDKRQKPHGREL